MLDADGSRGPVLSDDEWAEVAVDVMHRTGLSRRGDDGGCRWVAVRHADDHIHIAAFLARQDGAPVRLFNDWRQVHEAARAAEARYGLAAVPPSRWDG